MSTATLKTPVEGPVTLISKAKRARPLFDPPIVKRAITDSFVKLSPKTLWKNPVMFVVEIGAALTTVLLALHASGFALQDRKSTRLNSSHANISYAVFYLKKKTECGLTPALPS